MRRHISSLLFLLLAAPVALTGCSKDSKSLTGIEAQSTQPLSNRQADENTLRRTAWLPRVLFVHASPDAPAVDILVGRRTVAEDVTFPQNTGYERFFPGNRRVRVNVANTATSVIDARVPFEAGKAYSVFAIDKVANLGALVLSDDLTPPAKGMAHVRFIHLSPDAPAVDVALQGGAVVFGNKSFKDYTAFTPLPAGSYDLEVRPAGSTAVVLPLPGIKLEAGKIYTVFAKGLLGGTGNQALGAGIIVNRDCGKWNRWMSDGLAEPFASND